LEDLKKPHILIVSEKVFPEGGGAELATHLILQLLSSKGFGITVLTGTRQPMLLKGVNYVYSPYLKANYKVVLWKNSIIMDNMKWFVKLVNRVDILYIPGIAYPLISVAKNQNKKVIVHLHNYQPISYSQFFFYGQTNRFSDSLKASVKFGLFECESLIKSLVSAYLTPINLLNILWLNKADIIICVSQRQAEIVSNFISNLAYKIRVIYNPLPENLPIEKKYENPTFTYAGGGSYVKGFYILMQGALRILKHGSNVNFVLAGNLKYKQREIIRNLNNIFAEKFKSLGFLSYQDILRLYSKSHAVLFPSICEEPLPYVIMEAMAMGTIPIASKVGGIPEIVQGTYAEKMLFEPENIEEFVDKMESLLTLSTDRIKDIGFGLREVMLKRFSKEKVSEELEQIFLNE
jgi:glycosyltransferase involved in cell wall biosynthesis